MVVQPLQCDRGDDDDRSAVKVGLCGWTTSMASYVQRFPVVEVQHTFHEPPTNASQCRTQVPGSFEFTMKAWQRCRRRP